MQHVADVAVSILFDGLAYAMILFVISVGLSVTMGLMGFVNLAHGAFAMAGGYLTVTLTVRHGVPFLLALAVAFLVVGGASVAIASSRARCALAGVSFPFCRVRSSRGPLSSGIPGTLQAWR